jgi:hypothetical protein
VIQIYRPFIWRMMFDKVVQNFRDNNKEKVDIEELEKVFATKEYQDILLEYDNDNSLSTHVILNLGEFALLFDTMLKFEERNTTNKLLIKEVELLKQDFAKNYRK